MKKILTLLTSLCLVFVGTLTFVHAEEGINDAEQRLLDYVSEKGMTVEGETLTFDTDSEEYQALYDYLALDGVDLTDQDVDDIRDSVKNVIAYLENFDENTEMTPANLAELLDLCNPALNVLDMNISYDSVMDELTIIVSGEEVVIPDFLKTLEDLDNVEIPDDESEGIWVEKIEPVYSSVVNKTGTQLEDTGEDFTSTYAIIGGMAMVLVAAGIFSLRKKEA